jgi:hypothetical protein
VLGAASERRILWNCSSESPRNPPHSTIPKPYSFVH